jgi:hypothetical protein
MNEKVALAAVTAVEGAHAYSAFCPSIFTIRRFRDVKTVQDVRDGELAGTIFALVLGVSVSALVKDPLPLYFAAGVAVIMVMVYEWALRT